MTAAQARALQRRLSVTVNLVNWGGVALLAVYFLVILPAPESDRFTPLEALIAGVVYSLGAAVSATRAGLRWSAPMWEWLPTGRPPTAHEQAITLGYPARLARLSLVRWALAAPLFGLLGLLDSPTFALEIGTSLALAALTIAAAVFLLGERTLRPATSLALDAQAPPAGTLGVGPRLMLAWLLCSALPVVMIALIPVGRDFERPEDLIAPTAFVAAAALGAGLLATKLTTIGLTRPLRALRDAADAVAGGDLDVRVAVDDASELGRLQAGFNAMVGGLAERERLRDLIDRSVGRDVAAEALEHGAALGGQVREVSALFVDVVGSTSLAGRERPERVVELLNGFFAAVVGAVEAHGGYVNKFEGDGALCLFGAPVDQPDHASRALAAARDLHGRLEGPGMLPAAIGVSCGEVVAGWVGTESRFEYTAVGDAVNEAARLTELAKERRGRLLASSAAFACAEPDERARWELGEEVLLRGRSRPTRVATPRPVASAAAAVAGRRAGGSG